MTSPDYGELVQTLREDGSEQDRLAADAIERQAREIAACEGALRNSGNMVRDLNDLCKAYEHELVIRGISLPGEPDMRGTGYAGEVGCG